MTAGLLAATFTVIASGALAQKPEAPTTDKAPGAKTDLRKDDPCAEPKTELKKRSVERKSDDRAKGEPKKP
jgi:hypothetical protein